MRFSSSYVWASCLFVAGLATVGVRPAGAWPAVTTTSSNVRGGPGVNYGVLGTLPAGSPVDVAGCTGSWCQTQYGYVSAGLLAQRGGVPAALPAYANTGAVYGAGAAIAGTGVDASHPGDDTSMAGPRTTIGVTNVRSGPGVEYDVVKTLPDFTKVEVTGCANSWCQTNEGYISLYLLSRGPAKQVLTPAAQPLIPGSQTRDSLAWSAGGGVAAAGYPSAARAYAPSTTVGSYAVAGTATTRGTAKVRSGPGTSYDTLGTLPAGSPVQIVGCTGSWCQTQYGYISSRLLAQGRAVDPRLALPTAVTARPAVEATYPAAGYQAPVAPATVARSTPAGAAVLGYAPAVPVPPVASAVQVPPSQVVPGAGAAIAGTGADASHPGDDTSMAGPRTTIGVTNVRSGPGVEYDVVKTLPDFTKVEVTGCANSWCQTNEGYISLYLLSRGPAKQVLTPAAQPLIPGSQTRDSLAWSAGGGVAAAGYPSAARAYAPSTTVGSYAVAGTATTRGTAKVRSGPGTSYDTLGTLPAGSPVQIVGCTGSWCQTQYGYVSHRLIDGAVAGLPAVRRAPVPATTSYPPGSSIGTVRFSPSQAPRYLGAPGAALDAANTPGATTATTVSDLNVRSGPGTSYDVLGTLPQGAPVSLSDCAGNWCQTQYGYVSALYLSDTAAPGPGLGAGLADPALAPAEGAVVASTGWEPVYPQTAALTAASLPVQETLGGLDTNWDGYGRGIGWTNWRTSWGPGYWGPALSGRNTMSNWGARPSYWGGRTTYWNVHPGYPTRAYRGDRNGNYYWSRRGEGRLPQAAGWYYGMGPRWQGPYAEGPGYMGRPVVWRPRSGIW